MNIFFRNTGFIREKGPQFLRDLGYVNVGFEALNASLIFGGTVWFQCNRPNSKLVWTIQLRKQGNSLKWLYERIMNPEDAVTNTVKEV